MTTFNMNGSGYHPALYRATPSVSQHLNTANQYPRITVPLAQPSANNHQYFGDMQPPGFDMLPQHYSHGQLARDSHPRLGIPYNAPMTNPAQINAGNMTYTYVDPSNGQRRVPLPSQPFFTNRAPFVNYDHQPNHFVQPAPFRTPFRIRLPPDLHHTRVIYFIKSINFVYKT